MSDEKNKIYKDMMADAKVKELLNSKNKPQSLDDMADVLGGVAKESGYPLSKDDFLSIFRGIEEKTKTTQGKVNKLSDSDLAAVSGGGTKDNAANSFCSDSYKDKENCWWDDGCDYIVNYYPYYLCSHDELDTLWEIVPYNG